MTIPVLATLPNGKHVTLEVRPPKTPMGGTCLDVDGISILILERNAIKQLIAKLAHAL